MKLLATVFAVLKPKRRWFQFSLRSLLLFVLVAAVFCSWFAVGMQRAKRQRESSSATSAIVRNMPVNNSYRCVGIAAVVEALLDGECADGNREDVPEQLAKQIYEALITGHQVRYGRHLVSDGERSAIDSKEALEKLSTMVADLYKEDYQRLIETEMGRRRLFQATAGHVRTRGELDEVLDRDTDKTEVFFACGTRSFPDGTVKETHHVVLICRGPNREMSVIDPNDPGAPIPCQVETDQHGLGVQWTCRYKDTGLITTQRYRIIPKERYFRTALRNKP